MLLKDLTCNCPRAAATAAAVADAISKAGGCDCDAGKALAQAYSLAATLPGGQALMAAAFANSLTAAQCLSPDDE